MLAQLLAEDHRPSPALWDRELVSSRLTAHEIFNRLHAYHASAAELEAAGDLLRQMPIVELTPMNLERALEPFPIAVKTLDGIHLATADSLRRYGHKIEFATYDQRLRRAAAALGFEIYELA